MKRILLLVFFLMLLKTGNSQNTFDTKTFHEAFKKIYTDGQKGFPETKGVYNGYLSSFYTFYRAKILLPGADSGQVSEPVIVGYPFVKYSFKPSKTLAEARAKEAKLHSALRNAWGSPLTQVKRNDTVKQFVFYKTIFYKTAEAARLFYAEFDTYIVYEKGIWLLELTINGVRADNVKSVITEVPAEPQLEKKILDLLVSMDNFFTSEQKKQINTTQYYTEYESQSSFFGKHGKVKVRPFETSFSYNAGSEITGTPANAKTVYEKLLSFFKNSGRFAFNQEIKEGNRTYIFATASNRKNIVPPYTLILEYYATEGLPSVGFLITRKKD
ncbi:MAG: hypothetical protein IPH18_06880 [Chitinophagaceae bacterium]|nr:hypothetical protein [Chitinophagaceae bacterium]